MPEKKDCFVIAPIGEPDSDTRKRSDQVLKHVIRPAVDSCGYKAIRADEIDKPGIITSQVIQHVVNAPLVIADLTERNPNVFYELALRHALRSPLVQLIKKGEPIPFDVAGTRTIYVDHKDLDSVETARNEIIDQVKALEKDPSKIETPISVSLDLQLLRQSEKPEERSLADLLAAVSDLRAGVGKLEAKIGTQDEEGVLDQIQTAIRNLPLHLDQYIEESPGSFSRHQRGRWQPILYRELLDSSGPFITPAVGILIFASYFRDSLPWFYELGSETYRTVKNGDQPAAMESIKEFQGVVDFITRGPWAHEILGENKEMYVRMKEYESLLDHALRRLRGQLSHSPGSEYDS